MGRLEFYWYETNPSEESGTAWGQLASAAHRLHFVCDEIQSCAADAPFERALERLAYHMENYLVRVYELRERAVGLAATIDGRPEIARLLKGARHRKDALDMLRERGAVFCRELEDLLPLLDSDIALRNLHTHEQFLAVGLWTEDDIYDPADALNDLSSQPDNQRLLREFLVEDTRRLIEEHVAKGKVLFDATWALLEEVSPEIYRHRLHGA